MDEQVSLPPEPPYRGAMGEPCLRCKEKPATHRWGDALAQTHGFALYWCERCVVEAQLAHALERAERIPELQERLAALGGRAETRLFSTP